MRRVRGGFGGGASSTTESLRSGADIVEEDPDLNAAAMQQVPRLPAPPAIGDEHGEGSDGTRRRLAEAAMAGDAAYAKEYRLGLLHKLMMRGISLDNIAREMGVSLSTVRNDRKELQRRLRENAKELDIYALVGEQKAFYDETTALALRVVSQPNMPTPMRLAGIRTALAAKADQTRFLASAGVFDVLAFRRGASDEELSDVAALMARTDDMLSRLLADESAAEAPPKAPAKPRVVRRGGFKPMSFDDSDASGSANEIQDL